MPNFSRSGLKVMQVQFSEALHFEISGVSLSCMLFRKVWRYRRPEPPPSHVSTTNSVEKTFASFAPYPLRPPVSFFSSSL